MVHFVGAGPGAPDLITRRGAALLADADCIIYAGSLVNPALLGLDAARELARDLHHQALAALAPLPYNTHILRAFADYIVERAY